MKIAILISLMLQVASAKEPAMIGGQPGGSHGVRNLQYQLFLRPREASNKDGEPIVLYPEQPWKCMAWRFEPAGAGTRLVNYFTSKSFEVGDSGRALVQMPASADRKEDETIRFIALKDGLYEIDAHGGALTAVDSGGRGDLRVVVAPWKDTAAQKWQLVDLPDHFTM